MFINAAFAAAPAAAATPAPSLLEVMFLPLLLMAIFYFLLIRPQRRRMMAEQTMQKSLRRGDRVVTVGGIVGKLGLVGELDKELPLEIAPGVQITILRSHISAVLDKEASDNKKSDALAA